MTARSVIAARDRTPRFVPLGKNSRARPNRGACPWEACSLPGDYLGHADAARAGHFSPSPRACRHVVVGASPQRAAPRSQWMVVAALVARLASAKPCRRQHSPSATPPPHPSNTSPAGLYRAQDFEGSSQAMQRSAVPSSAAVRPNKSFNLTRRGKAPWPCAAQVHHASPGQGALPRRAGY